MLLFHALIPVVGEQTSLQWIRPLLTIVVLSQTAAVTVVPTTPYQPQCPQDLLQNFVTYTYSRDAANTLGDAILAPSPTACANMCFSDPACRAFNYRQLSERCELKHSTFPNATTTYNVRWTYYYRQIYKCIQQPTTTTTTFPEDIFIRGCPSHVQVTATNIAVRLTFSSVSELPIVLKLTLKNDLNGIT